MLERIFGRNLKYFQYFYSYLGSRIFLLAGLSFVVGLLDGFGLALFIPLIMSAAGDEAGNSPELGEMDFLLDGFAYLGFPITVTNILIFMTLLFALKGFFKFLDSYYKVQLQISFVKTLRFEMLDGLGGTSYQNFVNLDAGRIQNTLSGEVYKVTGAFISYFNTLQYVVLLMVYFGLALLSDWQFALLVSLGGYLSNFFFKMLFSRTEKASISISSKGHAFQSYLIQAVQHFKYLKATSYFSKYRKKLVRQIHEIEDLQKRIGFYNSLLNGMREPLILVIVVVVIAVQINLMGGEFATILLSLMFFYRALNYVISIQSSWQLFISQYGGIVAVNEIIELFSGGAEVSSSRQEKVEKIEEINLNQVEFRFQDGERILKNVNLRIRKNETVAFVGPSGSGKTTLVNILVGLLRPSAGVMEVNGKNKEKLDFDAFRNKIGYITQEPVIFSDTVYNNVTFWAEKTKENLDKFWYAISSANLLEFIEASELREDLLLGDNGVKASGGQKQRISIARELFKEAEIIVFDEATSALDSDSERVIQENINSLHGKYTIILIAHRLSTIKDVDRIYLLRNGEIQSSGDFKSLMDDDQDFRRMVQLQEF
ncbi:ABC transporter ATP-binding protein [Algoriphagus namhaensis]